MKILVAMSGGVDSTVSAYLLKKEGHEVIGVNFNFTNANECAPNNVGAKQCEPNIVGAKLCEPNIVGAKQCEPVLKEISNKLDIEIINRDYHDEFKNKVIASFVRDYENGITPNPCAFCNGEMKFAKLLEVMKEIGADKVATGHYANVVKTDFGNYCVKKSANLRKDQSYMLYRLKGEQLSHIIFPLGDMDKADVRKLAGEIGLSVADKKDSQDLCFISSDTDYSEYIKQFELGVDYKDRIARGELDINEIENLPFLRKGEFVDEDGKVLGYHKGIINYTVGQRKGLNIAFGERKFVKKIDAVKNQVVLSNNENLLSSEFKIYDIVFSGHNIKNIRELSDNKVSYFAKLRYRHDGTMCCVDFSNYIENGDSSFAICKLDEPVRAITPGQAAVFYDECGRVMFGGRISL